MTYIVFDVLRLDGVDLTRPPLRRAPRRRSARLDLPGPRRSSPPCTPTARSCGRSPREHGLEGVVAKRRVLAVPAGATVARLGQGRRTAAPAPRSSAAGARRRPGPAGWARCCSARATPTARCATSAAPAAGSTGAGRPTLQRLARGARSDSPVRRRGAGARRARRALVRAPRRRRQALPRPQPGRPAAPARGARRPHRHRRRPVGAAVTPERQMVDVEGRQVRVSHLDKVMYPSTGTTKAEVMNYLVRVAPALLPQLRDRPVTRIRWPDGVAGEKFFEKNTPRGAPDWVRRQTLRAAPGAEDEGAELELPFLDDLAGLVWAANQGALELHTPQWRVGPRGGVRHAGPARRRPRPRRAGRARRVRAGRPPRRRPAARRRPGQTVPVTSGSKGMQLYAPLPGNETVMEVRQYARDLAYELAAAHPRLVVAIMKKDLRGGKVLLDWSQNHPAKTTITPYSLRGRERPARRGAALVGRGRAGPAAARPRTRSRRGSPSAATRSALHGGRSRWRRSMRAPGVRQRGRPAGTSTRHDQQKEPLMARLPKYTVPSLTPSRAPRSPRSCSSGSTRSTTWRSRSSTSTGTSSDRTSSRCTRCSTRRSTPCG